MQRCTKRLPMSSPTPDGETTYSCPGMQAGRGAIILAPIRWYSPRGMQPLDLRGNPSPYAFASFLVILSHAQSLVKKKLTHRPKSGTLRLVFRQVVSNNKTCDVPVMTRCSWSSRVPRNEAEGTLPEQSCSLGMPGDPSLVSADASLPIGAITKDAPDGLLVGGKISWDADIKITPRRSPSPWPRLGEITRSRRCITLWKF